LLGVAAGALKVLNHLGQRRLLHTQRFGRLLRHALWQSQPPRNLNRVACPRCAHQQAVGRLQRFEVELHRSVDELGVAVRKRLQFAVVGGGDHARLALQQRLQDSARQRRALRRVGARPQLVQQHEAVPTLPAPSSG
jgi:hypothetical protein